MKNALRKDRARTNVLPISELGLLQMTRQRAEAGVLSTMYVDCPYCAGHGSVRSPLSMSVDIQRRIAAVMRTHARSKTLPDLVVTVHPRVLQRLRTEDEQILVDMQNRFSGGLNFRSDPAKHVEFFSVANATTNEVYFATPER
jgi:ribonuclease G